MRMLAILANVFLLHLSGTAVAQEEPYNTAVESWLNGSEAEGLQGLSEAASQGNSSAQMILGQIDRDTVPGGFSDYLIDHPGRDQLLRAPDPDKGTVNWLLALSDPALKANGEAVFGYRVGRQPISNAIALQSHGEVEGAEYVLWNTLNNGRFDLINSMPAENYGLSEAGFLKWIEAYMARENKAITMRAFVEEANPKRVSGLLGLKRLARLLNLNQHFSDEANQFTTVMLGRGSDLPESVNLVRLNENISRISETDSYLNIVKRYCESCEGDTVDYDCVVQALEIAGGYKTLMSIRTPVETSIDQATFMNSKRPVEIFSQLVNNMRRYYSRDIRSSCIAANLKAKL
ncbi:hypothetical protein [uncultured Ruegeria sp.]|uniref:hypothetical protein n=1 Tax=uncultured Ruegeria sp. TaxID=259304 RepID=UPI0026247449|nr:hypothetical protein [uncultured Ruegeria sp.]